MNNKAGVETNYVNHLNVLIHFFENPWKSYEEASH
jgi:hypothetical protein